MTVDRRVRIGIERGQPVEIEVDGERLSACEGETIAAALFAAGRRVFRRTANQAAPRGMFCGMGICFDCLMTVDGVPNVRACVIPVRPGMVVQTQDESGWGGGR